MADLKYLALRGAFEFFWATRLSTIVRMLSRSRGIIFTLHRVVPGAPADFSPNSILQITPEFLEFAVRRIRELGHEIVSMDEAVRRIKSTDPEKKFAVFTFDDAYRDNLTHALPIMQRNQAPFVLYVPTGLVDGIGEVWWQALEDIIAGQVALAVPETDGTISYLETKSLSQKHAAYKKLYWDMRAMPNSRRVSLIRELGMRYGVDISKHCRELIMDWTELQQFADEPLCTLGAHTVRHFELATLEEQAAADEIQQSAEILEAQFGKLPKHLSYPIGAKVSASDREFEIAKRLGFETAVTTRPGAIYYSSRKTMTQLPRVSLNGNFQSPRYMDVFAAGAIFDFARGVFKLIKR